MYDHPEIYPNALAGVTMEHLGCTMWADNADGEYVATGGYEWGSTYTTPRQGRSALLTTTSNRFISTHVGHEPLRRRRHPVVTMLPAPLFFGEGAPLYAGGLGTVSVCPLPTYLLQAGSRTQPSLLNLDKLDKKLI